MRSEVRQCGWLGNVMSCDVTCDVGGCDVM